MLRKGLYKDLDRFKITRNLQKKRYYDKTVDADNRYLRWTKQEDILVMSHGIPDRELSIKIQRSMNAILVRRNRLKNEVIKENKKMKIQKYKRGQIWWYNAGPNFDGSTYTQGKARPIIIISNDIANANSSVLIGVPCTTQDKKDMPTHTIFEMNNVTNTAMSESLMSINIDKLGTYIGTADDELIEKIEGTILVALGMKEVIRERATKRNEPQEVGNNDLMLVKENGIIEKPNELALKMIQDANRIKDKNDNSNFSAITPIFEDDSPLEEKLSTRKAYKGVGRKGYQKYTKKDMIRFISDCENHTIEWVTKKYSCTSEKAASNKLYRFRKFLKENP